MRLLALGSLLALAACNPPPATYPADTVRNFAMACEAQGSSRELCGCVWERIETNVPPGDFAALERLPGPEREIHPLTTQINGYVEACNVTLSPPESPGSEEQVPAP
jgi:hypothetical protein